MRLLALLGGILTLLPSTTTAFPNITAPLLPWRITRVVASSANAYTGSHPYSNISFTISDPNRITVAPPDQYRKIEFPPTTADCFVYWQSYSEDPRKADFPPNTCSPISSGKWTFDIREGNINIGVRGTAVTRNFVAVVRLSEAVVLESGGVWQHKYEGRASFAVTWNLVVVCEGDGTCSNKLMEEKRPVLVEQKLVEAKCIIGDCDI
ncbi:hypothetical protein QBC43DRAFT_137086 [Cladorrhinum sp. PSN259]|nr:hypothetical protein QBC43DRAFT_137086 [Cladorrhinum sp. PSN259]